MSDLYAISRVEFYKVDDANKIFGEAVRGLHYFMFIFHLILKEE